MNAKAQLYTPLSGDRWMLAIVVDDQRIVNIEHRPVI